MASHHPVSPGDKVTDFGARRAQRGVDCWALGVAAAAWGCFLFRGCPVCASSTVSTSRGGSIHRLASMGCCAYWGCAYWGRFQYAQL
jgi:nicotinic acid phosphoribosyltransferase